MDENDAHHCQEELASLNDHKCEQHDISENEHADILDSFLNRFCGDEEDDAAASLDGELCGSIEAEASVEARRIDILLEELSLPDVDVRGLFSSVAEKEEPRARAADALASVQTSDAYSFEAVLFRSLADDKLGIIIGPDGRNLVVQEVTGGLVQQWNASRVEQIRAGERITAVNGCYASACQPSVLRERLCADVVLRISIARFAATLHLHYGDVNVEPCRYFTRVCRHGDSCY